MSTLPSPVAKETLMGSFIWRDKVIKAQFCPRFVDTKRNGRQRKLAFKIASEAMREWHLKVFIRSLGSYRSHPLFEFASQPTIPSIGHCVWYPSFLYIDKNKCFTSRLDHVLSLHLSPSLMDYTDSRVASLALLRPPMWLGISFLAWARGRERQETLCYQEAERGRGCVDREQRGFPCFTRRGPNLMWFSEACPPHAGRVNNLWNNYSSYLGTASSWELLTPVKVSLVTFGQVNFLVMVSESE